MGLAEGPLASIPWAYNEVGPNSMARNYSIKTFQGTYPLLSLELLATSLPSVGYIFVA